MKGMLHPLAAWSGLAAGPFGWALSTQANYAWVTLRCQSGGVAAVWVALASALLAVLGALVSWRSLRHVETAPALLPRKPRTERFIAMLGVGLGALFTLVILFQLAAALVFGGCER
jgi:hypothetical protein